MRSMFPSQSVFLIVSESSGTPGSEASKRDHLMVTFAIKANPRRHRYNGLVKPVMPQRHNQQTMSLKR
jgi:hypothetical protein